MAASLQAPELFKIAQDLSRIRIEAQVNEADVGAIAEGNPATFTVDAYPDRQFEGKVTQVRLAATELNNVVTYTVIVEATNADRKLFPGMTANVIIETAKREGVLRIANDALRYKPRAEPGQAARATATARRRSDRMIQRVKDELQLTAEQETTLKVAMAKLAEEMRAQTSGIGGSPPDPSAMRQRTSARVEQTLAPILTEAQRPLLRKMEAGSRHHAIGRSYGSWTTAAHPTAASCAPASATTNSQRSSAAKSRKGTRPSSARARPSHERDPGGVRPCWSDPTKGSRAQGQTRRV